MFVTLFNMFLRNYGDKYCTATYIEEIWIEF